MADIDYEKLKASVRALSLSVRKEMAGRGGYRVRPGDGENLGKIAVGLGDMSDKSYFPEKFEGFEIIFLPLDKVF